MEEDIVLYFETIDHSEWETYHKTIDEAKEELKKRGPWECGSSYAITHDGVVKVTTNIYIHDLFT